MPDNQAAQTSRNRPTFVDQSDRRWAASLSDVAYRPFDERCGLCRSVGPLLRGCRCAPTGRPIKVPIIAIDIDGVLADISDLILNRLRRAHGLNLDRQALTTFRLADNPLVSPTDARAVLSWLNAGALSDAVPLTGAAAGVNRLTQRAHILYWTSRSVDLREATERWLGEHGFPLAPLVVAPNGDKTLIHTRFDACIDDDPTVVRFIAENGRVAFLFSQPWTARVSTDAYKNIYRISSWAELAPTPAIPHEWGRI